jgi:hypothetical protein
LSATPDGTSVVVLARNRIRIVGLPDLRTVATFDLMVGDNPLSDARCLAADPTGEIAVVVDAKLAAALVVDLDRRKVTGVPVPLGDLGGDGAAVSVAMSPAGTHVAVTGLGDHLGPAARRRRATRRVGAHHRAGAAVLPAGDRRGAGPAGRQRVHDEGTRHGSGDLAGGADRGRHAIPVRLRRARFGRGAVAQLLWRGKGCVGAGSETVPVTPFNIDFQTALERVPPHELVVESPLGATQGPAVTPGSVRVTGTLRRRHVKCGIAIEEPAGLQMEADVGDRHDRPVLRTSHVVGTERVPEDDVLVPQRAVLLDVLRQARTAPALIGVVACCVPLARRVLRHPHMMGDETGALQRRGVLVEHVVHVLAGQELVADRVANMVDLVLVADLPVTRAPQVDVPLGL